VSRLAALTRRRTIQAGAIGFATTVIGPRSTTMGRAQDATPTPGDDPFPADTERELTAIVDASLAETNTPGALVGVWYPGRGAWTMAAGVSDVETGDPMSLDDHVRIASITKTFVATIVLQLVEEELLSLDDHLADYITGIPNGEEITLRQLLNMTAGIFDYTAAPPVANGYAINPLLPFTPEQAVDAIRKHDRPDFAPGTDVRYSNSNYILLGMIIEEVTGNRLPDEISQRIITPLGLSHTSFPTTPDLPEPFAHGYQASMLGGPLRDVTRSNPSVPWAAGAMISTLADLKIWAEALATGALLTPKMQAERLAFQRPPSGPQDFGYGLGIFEVDGFIGHNGGIPGYNSWLLQERETGSIIIVVTNLTGTADPIVFEVIQLLFPDRVPAAATPVAAPSS
jgi:D-alanyl-D-alanine carboxypeptidase